MLLRAVSLSLAFGAIGLFLEGCGGAQFTTTTVTTTTVTTVTTTTVTTTTTTNMGQCDHQDLDTLSPSHHGMSIPCFCLYTGQCADFAPVADCKGMTGRELTDCQIRICGSYTMDLTPWTASFKNLKDSDDVLTIPVIWLDDIKQMSDWCDRPADLIKTMLQDGRRVYTAKMGIYGGPPQMQCIHLPNKVDVRWLHLHSFNKSVPGEGLPSGYPNATCITISDDLDADTKGILDGMNPKAATLTKNVDIVI